MKDNSKYNKDWRNRYPEKRLAHSKVNYALRTGLLVKGICFCGVAKVEAHHDDYNKPLDVMWLCRKHHIERHRELGFTNNGESKQKDLADKIKPYLASGLSISSISKELGISYNLIYKANKRFNK